jgi:hypothetical protein
MTVTKKQLKKLLKGAGGGMKLKELCKGLDADEVKVRTSRIEKQTSISSIVLG